MDNLVTQYSRLSVIDTHLYLLWIAYNVDKYGYLINKIIVTDCRLSLNLLRINQFCTIRLRPVQRMRVVRSPNLSNRYNPIYIFVIDYPVS